jgi:hypothetical protein
MEIFVLTKTKAYGCTGEDPETTILRVGDRSSCEREMNFLAEKSHYDVHWHGDTVRWVDDDEDSITVLEIHKSEL